MVEIEMIRPRIEIQADDSTASSLVFMRDRRSSAQRDATRVQ